MNDFMEKYDMETAAAWVLGHAKHTGIPVLPAELLEKNAGELSDDELFVIVAAAQKAELKLYPFKLGTQVTSLDLLEKRVTFLNELSDGGFTQLHAEQKDICQQPFSENSFDVVNMLEVLEHIPKVEKAIAAAVKMAKQYVVVSVPSKPDNNPEHIHLFTREKLTQMFGAVGCTRLHFDGTQGHLFMVAAVETQSVFAVGSEQLPRNIDNKCN